MAPDATRAALELFATPAEHAELVALMLEAAALDARRHRITASINILRQRLAQRRLAAERGRPFVGPKPRLAPPPT
ncbi:hypothetical protein KPL78_19210 [Roseomonas sp. HJA6]|uniref:Uncharacterized protein n=1 Tax=Roseomonas alba TaxID=2846776 RepID=A0ABS7ACV0_9PROT|nr:hypothetical protein [Neoroseomonas alba]MBW6399998.1 hypothetical protein [Neoroseomonas alba]